MLQGLFIAIFFQSLILSALCFASVPKNAANKWLGIFLLMIAFQRFFQYILSSTDWLYKNPLLLITFELSVLACSFALHHYVLQVLGKNKRLANMVYGFTNLLIIILFYSAYFSGWWADVKSYYHTRIFTLFNILVMIYSFFVIIDSIGRIRRAEEMHDLDNNQIRFTLNAVKWLLYYWIFRTVIALIFIPIRMANIENKVELARLENGYLLLVNSILIILLAFTAYFALRNPAFFEQMPVEEEATVEQKIVMAVLPENEKKLLKTTISNEEAQRLLEQLSNCMHEKKAWLNTKLTISKLSEICAIPAYKITKVIKQSGNHNFNEFVNHYRVEEAKKLLMHPEHNRDTMYSVALDSGFASEAPFYSAFKKATGLSPSAWREQQSAGS